MFTEGAKLSTFAVDVIERGTDNAHPGFLPTHHAETLANPIDRGYIWGRLLHRKYSRELTSACEGLAL